MKSINLSVQGLAVLIFFVFTACDHWGGLSPEAQKGTGKLVPVRIGAINIAGGAQNKTVTRASGQKRIVGEPISLSFGNGMLAEITVEEDVSALRAEGDTPLDNGVKFRVFALETSEENKVLYSYGDYEIKNSAVAPINNTNLHVQLNKTYDFVCISYNNTTLPDDEENYEEGEELPLLSASTSKEILYWREEAKKITGDFTLEILLRPQFVKVKLKFDWNSTYNAGWYISEIAAGSPALQGAGTSGDFNLATGKFSSVSSDAAFTGWTSSGAGTSTVWESTLTFIPSATVDSLKFSREVIKVSTNGLASDPYLIPTPLAGTSQALALGTTVEQGKSYSLFMRFRLSKFASSNIYWDNTTNPSQPRLTFKPYSDNPAADYATEQLYQGVFFKWGSLAGVSPVGDFSVGTSGSPSTGTPIYLYKETGWVQTNAASEGWDSWWDIPYLDPNPVTANSRNDRSVIDLPENPYLARYKGDICQQISKVQGLFNDNGKPLYRLPTMSEFGPWEDDKGVDWTTESANGGWKRVDGSNASWSEINSQIPVDADTHAGRYTGISNGGKFSLAENFFPVSGQRFSSATLVVLGPRRAGHLGYYYTGGARNDEKAQSLLFTSTKVNTNDWSTPSNFTLAVRCMVNPD